MNRRTAMLGIGTAAAVTAAGGWWISEIEPPKPILSFPSTSATPSSEPSIEPSAEVLATEPWVPAVSVETVGWVSWALMDRTTGKLATSGNATEQNNTASMIKVWLAADYLRRLSESGKTPGAAKLAELSEMIRDSANEPASTVFSELGRSATITRMNSICGTSAKAGDGYGRTRMSAQDACRLANAAGAGIAAGPKWTEWLLSEMRQVRGDGDFGIRLAFPAVRRPEIAIKNGWDTWDVSSEWTVNCLAVTQEWAMSVLTRYPEKLGKNHGVAIAQEVASQLMTTSRLT